MSYTHFTLEERKYLQQLLSEGKSFREIAAALGRSPSSISREVKRNRSKTPRKTSDNPYQYHHWRANTLAVMRRRNRRRSAIEPDSPQWEFVLTRLRWYWPPETICASWSMLYPEQKPLHFSTIYRYIAKGVFPNIHPNTHLRRHGKRFQTRNANYNTIHPDRIIPQWPEEIRNRSRIGDWEGDTVYGGVGKGLLVTLVDRRSRYVRIGLLKNRSAELTRPVIEQLLDGLPVKSISLDNGSEFAGFRELEQALNTLVYFAEPHKPWQRGTNENTNDMIRFFFPKGFDFRNVSEEDIAFVEALLNNRPRKCLNWKTPREVFFENCVALD